MRIGGIAPDLELADVLGNLTDQACKVIQAQASGEQPLLLYLAYTAPHTPWLPAEEFVGKSGAGMYGDFQMTVDAKIGRVLAAIDQAKLTGETLLIFTSDNGPVWYPKDIEKFGHDSLRGLRGMKGDAWEGGHRLPFIVRWPGRVGEGSVSDQTICYTDLLATFADIFGTDLPADAGPDSFSILPVLESRQPVGKPIRGPVVMKSGSKSTMMIRSGDWKLINKPGSGGFSKSKPIEAGDPPGQLYNLRDDPAEKTNLFRKHPEIATRLSTEMKRIVASPRSREK